MSAEQNARALLEEYLTRKQLRDLKKKRYFEVKGKNGIRKSKYRIRDDGVVSHWCINFRGGFYPDSDRALAMKLLIESDEEMFRSIAVYHG